jgi:hypothetical protein
MLYIAVKALVSGVIIAAVSEIAKRSPGIGALILSLPLVSILAFIWLWRDAADKDVIAALANSTFWFVLPTLPMFLVLPALLRGGASFWTALGLSCLLTIVLYAGMVWVLGRSGPELPAPRDNPAYQPDDQPGAPLERDIEGTDSSVPDTVIVPSAPVPEPD